MARALTCPACGSAEPKRHGESLCRACSQAAGEVASSPSWVFDSPLLRQALASANVPAVLAIVRTACGLPQRDIAAVAGWTPSAMSYYERGRRAAVFDIRMLLQFADTVGMPRPALFALVLGDAETLGIAGASAAVSAPAWPADQPAAESRLRYWQACTDALYQRARKADGRTMLRPALVLWEQVRAAHHTSGRESWDLAVVAAGAALCAGQFALESGENDLAGSLHDTAQNLADEAPDPMLNAQVLAARALLETETARAEGSRTAARRALLLAREAAEEGRYLPVPELHAMIAVRHAAAAALTGDSAVFTAAIARARRELDRAIRVEGLPLPAWLRPVSHDYISATESAGYADLAEVEDVVKAGAPSGVAGASA